MKPPTLPLSRLYYNINAYIQASRRFHQPSSILSVCGIHHTVAIRLILSTTTSASRALRWSWGLRRTSQ
eukprot:COSAG06_NODE_5591_length_3378_cov_1.351327_4_plen_69_part_00